MYIHIFLVLADKYREENNRLMIDSLQAKFDMICPKMGNLDSLLNNMKSN